MINYANARARVQAAINQPDPANPDRPPMVILESATIERDYGWVFHYTTRRHHETGSLEDYMPGNAPILVTRHDGLLHPLGVTRTIEQYLADWERLGRFDSDAG
jgi:hypothetical protein